jgi:hypothetical protein
MTILGLGIALLAVWWFTRSQLERMRALGIR